MKSLFLKKSMHPTDELMCRAILHHTPELSVVQMLPCAYLHGVNSVGLIGPALGW